MFKSGILLIAVNTLLPLLFLLASKMFPPKEKDRLTLYEIADCEREFRKWINRELLFFALYITVLCSLWYNLLHAVASGYFASKRGSFLVLGFQNAAWFVPALFLAVFTSIPIIEMTYRHFLKEKYQAYIAYTNRLSGIDGRKILGILSWIIVPLFTFTILIMDCYTRFTLHSIYRNDFWSFREIRYDYHEIGGITKKMCLRGRNGEILYGRPFYVIDFKDGYELILSNKAVKTREFEKRYLKRIMRYSGIGRVEVKK